MHKMMELKSMYYDMLKKRIEGRKVDTMRDIEINGILLDQIKDIDTIVAMEKAEEKAEDDPD